MKKIVSFLILFFIFSLGSLFAQSKSDQLKTNKKKIEADIATTTKLLEQTKQNKNTSLQQISMLRKQISNREELITTLNTEIYNLEEELDQNIKLSQSLDKKMEYMKADYSRIVYTAYKNRKMIDKITFILSSEDFSQMYRKLKYYSMFGDNVKHQAELIRQTKEEIEKKNQEILALKEGKTTLLTGKEQEVRRLETDRNEQARTAESLKKKEKQLAAELSTKQKKRKELDAAIKKAIQEEILAENARKAKKAKEKGASTATTTTKTSNKMELTLTPEEQLLSSSFVSNQGKLPWPVVRGVKISDFGNYPHPDVPSVMIENRGIDILVENGTEVRSVFDGEVTGVLEMMGTKVLMIRHGEYITVYQNLANVTVKKGDNVKTKQVIATVAKPGSASDYELHFEVWKNNSYLNPNLWLSKR